MDDYNKLKEFWDSRFAYEDVYKPEAKFIEDDRINNIFKKYINKDSYILDYGCGSGWAIPEIYYTAKFKRALGIDQSINAIKASTDTIKATFPSLDCVYTNESKEYDNEFDFIFSCNTLDVVPKNVLDEMLGFIYKALKKDSYALICLNPIFSLDEVKNVLKMDIKNNYIYKDGILRGALYSVEEWINIFKTKFSVIEYDEFYISKSDKYKRRYYLLKKDEQRNN